MIITSGSAAGQITTDITVKSGMSGIVVTVESFTTASLPSFVIATGEAQLRGPPGPGISTLVYAGETISALRVVYERLGKSYLLNPSDSANIDLRLGLSSTAGELGTGINVQVLGSFDDSSWNWSEGLVFLGPNGTLTQVAPTSGWLLVVGFASSPTRITLNFGTPILLA